MQYFKFTALYTCASEGANSATEIYNILFTGVKDCILRFAAG